MGGRRGMRGRDEDGRVLSLVVLLLVITGASVWLVGEVAEVAEVVVDRASARTASDAAGLATASHWTEGPDRSC